MNLLQASLTGGTAFKEVRELLTDLTFAEACQPVPPLPYTLAELLAHLHATMQASLNLATGQATQWPEDLDLWPPVETASQLDLLLGELHLQLALAQALAANPASNTRDILQDLAVHNAYHWGQVALMRRLAAQQLGD